MNSKTAYNQYISPRSSDVKNPKYKHQYRKRLDECLFFTKERLEEQEITNKIRLRFGHKPINISLKNIVALYNRNKNKKRKVFVEDIEKLLLLG